ncbi:hypothetical protein [Marinitoga lauensis]|nr:hypothetical protein [Marinitoga lauensis]
MGRRETEKHEILKEYLIKGNGFSDVENIEEEIVSLRDIHIFKLNIR